MHSSFHNNIKEIQAIKMQMTFFPFSRTVKKIW